MCSTKQRLAAVLREQRVYRGYTLRQAAARAGIAASTLSRWESGTCLPRVPELEALFAAFSVPKREVVRILASLDAPRAAKAARRSIDTGSAEEMAPAGGSILRFLRRRSGMTLSELSERLGVAPSTVSRWESSSAHPSSTMAQTLLDILGATDDERACFGSSGVAKIKADRPDYSEANYIKELHQIAQATANGNGNPFEVRLLQIQSALWWALHEPQAPELLRLAHVVYAELLLADRRYTDAIAQAESVLESSLNSFDGLGIRAQCVLARAESSRAHVSRPHLGLLILQRCLLEADDEESRLATLEALAELSLLGRRPEEARSYARRALELANRTEDPRALDNLKRVLLRINLAVESEENYTVHVKCP